MAPLLKQDLSAGWEFKLTDDASPDAWLPVARVPSVVHMDLLAHRKIPDPSLGMNELDVQWVGEQCWSYRCTFASPPKDTLRNAHRRIHLVFEGLDTFATVYLNGTQILECDNMFVAHRVDVTTALAPGNDAKNTLQINFSSAVVRGREIVAAHPEHQYVGTLGSDERMAVRKAQYHWGWDWGPALVTAGPWRPVRLEMFDSRIEGVAVRYALSPSLKNLKGTITTRVSGVTAGTRIKTLLRAPDGVGVVFAHCHDVDLTGEVLVQFDLTNPLLWQPHGYGMQHRYTVEVELLTAGGILAHTETRRVGFRTATLVEENDAHGMSFYFRINNTDIFAGGSCWIPADMLPPKVTADDYRAWLTMMVEGNQIMTRVWGGGYYEDDAFYDICDELGILVWQDFMFACGSYPANPAFLKSVEIEARQILRRLAHHPAIVLYAGGNENHFIQEHCQLSYDWNDKDPQSWLKTSFPSRYIYQHLLPTIMAQEAPFVSYRPDSPWNNGRPIMSWDQTVGDLHQWNVWHADMRLYQDFGKIGGRFNSEFGMQSLPHLSTIEHFVTDRAERHPQSSTMDFHNKCRDHEKRLATYIRDNFRAVDSGMKRWVYLSHLLQAEAVHYAYRSWRRDWGSAGARRCGGALVWQMNDLWPVTSWALVDSARLKKAAFYAIKRDLAPIAVGVVRTHHDWTTKKAGTRPPASCTYDVWVACDGSQASANVLSGGGDLHVELRFISIHTGRDVMPRQTYRIASSKVNANGTTQVCIAVSLKNPSSRDEAFVIAAKVSSEKKLLARDVDWPQPFKHLSFRNDRGLRVHRQTEPGSHGTRARLTITASRPVKGLILTERACLNLSDNGVDIIPGEEYTVYVDGLVEHDVLEWTYLGMDECQHGGMTNGNGNAVVNGLTKGHL
ncbi:hypothetical protein SBRCBS47491_003756 [Sporothrix bragantina]|uniref:Beta-mannosidase B n=1 Tax=Sporothrix bragantina TaxID=671064 RepID=A0ABP0BHZ8_9PEZI